MLLFVVQQRVPELPHRVMVTGTDTPARLALCIPNETSECASIVTRSASLNIDDVSVLVLAACHASTPGLIPSVAGRLGMYIINSAQVLVS